YAWYFRDWCRGTEPLAPPPPSFARRQSRQASLSSPIMGEVGIAFWAGWCPRSSPPLWGRKRKLGLGASQVLSLRQSGGPGGHGACLAQYAFRTNPSSALSGTFSHKGRRRWSRKLGECGTTDRATIPSPLVGEGGRRPDEGLVRKANRRWQTPG